MVEFQRILEKWCLWIFGYHSINGLLFTAHVELKIRMREALHFKFCEVDSRGRWKIS